MRGRKFLWPKIHQKEAMAAFFTALFSVVFARGCFDKNIACSGKRGFSRAATQKEGGE
ncbi:MAG: hypothetical protein AAB731_02715 [Patescibacteria group bacterium]